LSVTRLFDSSPSWSIVTMHRYGDMSPSHVRSAIASGELYFFLLSKVEILYFSLPLPFTVVLILTLWQNFWICLGWILDIYLSFGVT